MKLEQIKAVIEADANGRGKLSSKSGKTMCAVGGLATAAGVPLE